MKIVVYYDGPTKAERERQALLACEDYLGLPRLNMLADYMARLFRARTARRSVRLMQCYAIAGFAGVEGRTTVHALIRFGLKHNTLGA